VLSKYFCTLSAAMWFERIAVNPPVFEGEIREYDTKKSLQFDFFFNLLNGELT